MATKTVASDPNPVARPPYPDVAAPDYRTDAHCSLRSRRHRRPTRSAQAVSQNVQVRGDQRCETAAHTAFHLTVPLRHRAAVEADTGARQAGHRDVRPSGR